MSTPNVMRTIDGTEPAEEDRLDPEVLARDALWLIEHNSGDMQALIVALLRTVRENDTQQEAIRDGYSSSYRSLDQMHREVCAERNAMREAIRAVNRATRGIKVGRW